MSGIRDQVGGSTTEDRADRAFVGDGFAADWVSRFHQGDPAALREAFNRYAGMVRTMGLARSGNPREADALVRRVFVRAWRTRDAFDPQHGSGPLRSWLLWLTLRLLAAADRQHIEAVGTTGADAGDPTG